MIRVKSLYKISDIEKDIDDYFDRIEDVIADGLAYIGEMCVNHARINGNYTDQTGNLRSSIGFAVYRDGKKITGGDFKLHRNGHEGIEQGKRALEEAAREYNKGYVLIVTAGMKYAAYVEARHSLDVITSAEFVAEREAEWLLRELEQKVFSRK